MAVGGGSRHGRRRRRRGRRLAPRRPCALEVVARLACTPCAASPRASLVSRARKSVRETTAVSPEEPDARRSAPHENHIDVLAPLEDVPEKPPVLIPVVEVAVADEPYPGSSREKRPQRCRGLTSIALAASFRRVDLHKPHALATLQTDGVAVDDRPYARRLEAAAEQPRSSSPAEPPAPPRTRRWSLELSSPPAPRWLRPAPCRARPASAPPGRSRSGRRRLNRARVRPSP